MEGIIKRTALQVKSMLVIMNDMFILPLVILDVLRWQGCVDYRKLYVSIDRMNQNL
jgi:hypothetical protein